MKISFLFSHVTTLAIVFCLSLSCHAVQDAPWESQFSDILGADDADGPGPEYKFSGDFSIEEGKRSGTLNIALDIKEGWHGYSQKQLSGQTPTEFSVEKSDDFKVVGKFVPDQKPKAGTNELGEVEEFEGRVVWSAPIELGADAVPQDVVIKVEVFGQVCKTSCVQFGQDALVSAKFSKFTKSLSSFVSDKATISGKLDRAQVAPGETAVLNLTAKLASGWHIYKFEPFQPENTISLPTIIYFSKTSGFKVAEPVASKEAIKHETGLEEEPFSYYYEDEVTWSIDVMVPDDTESGTYLLEGKIIYLLCTEENCDRPTTLDFKVPLIVGSEVNDASVDVAFSVNEQDRDKLMAMSKTFWAEESAASEPIELISSSELSLMLVFAFLAGLILNAMPCVLPVIGLKVMSFVQQAGEKRGRIFLLNLVFSLGLLTVFWVLATLSAFFGFGWGDWLTKSMTGSIVITSVVFAFGLSMLGVWEIPIPGLSGSSSISKKSEEEGLLGAFFLGILTTILATPCTGPMLIPAVTATVGQPPWVAYLIFTTIGLGMALPYLLVGVFPSLIGWLPRPGAWMTTFKQITGFILLATVVFLMSSFSAEPRNEYLVAMMTTLLVISFGCWWIGQTSIAAESSEQIKAWGTGLTIIAVGAFVSFYYLGPAQHELDWQQYSKAKLGELLDENRLVFIDFTGPN